MGSMRCNWLGYWILAFASLSVASAQEAPKSSPPSQDARGGRRFDPERVKQLRDRFASGNKAEIAGLETKTWTVNGAERTALVYLPKKESKSDSKSTALPLIFVFHGHGGGSKHVATRFALHQEWPEAICVYPQGLPTAAPLIDPKGLLPGWQTYIGDQEDRDLQFFDAMLETLKKEHHIDPKHIYAAGHSNGAFFCYTLAAARGDQLAAIAPVAGALSPRDLLKQKPLPVFHVAGESDGIVKFAAQNRSLEQTRKLNGCTADGKKEGEFVTRYPSEKGTDVVTYIHPGGHEIPREAIPLIAEFLKAHAK